MIFPLKKILTVSARDYCDSINKPISDYELRGVIVLDNTTHYFPFSRLFLEKIPEGTEVVVSFNYSSDGIVYAGGTALIPKRKEEENMRKRK